MLQDVLKQLYTYYKIRTDKKKYNWYFNRKDSFLHAKKPAKLDSE